MIGPLRADEEARIERCVAALADEQEPAACGEALRALQNFCEGTPTLIPTLGTARFGLLPALVRLLDAGREVLPALQLLESLLHACHPNVKALLRVRGTVPALAGTLAGASTNASGAGTAVAVSVCSTIRVLMRYRPSMRADLISADGADAIASVLRTMMRGGAGSVEEGEVALQTVLQLAVELTAGDAAVQDVLRECGCLAELVDVLVAQLRLHLGLEPEPEPEAAGAGAGAGSTIAPVALSASSVADLCLCIGTLVADNDASRRTVLAQPDVVRTLHSGWGGASLEQLEGDGAGVAVRHSLMVLLVKLLSEAGASGEEVPGLTEGLPVAASDGLRAAFSAYHCFCENVRQTQRFHYDDDARQEALQAMQAQLEAQPASAHLFAHVTGSIQMLVNSFNVIDQTVLAHACLLAHKLFTESDATQLLFCREGGLAALYECLHDYDITVRTLVLKLLTVLASNFELPTRQDMVSEESGNLLPRLIALIQQYGQPDTDDVDLAVAEAACGLLSHLVLYEPISEELSTLLTSGASSVLEVGLAELEERAASRDGGETPLSARRRGSIGSGLGSGSASARGSPHDQVLTNLLIVGASQLGESRLQCPQPPLARLLQNLCHIMSTVTYQQSECQTRVLRSGLLDLVFELLSSGWLRSYGVELSAQMAALTLIVNAVDKNTEVQDALCDQTKAKTIVGLLQQSPSGSELQGLAALLVSHLCLNHQGNKALYGSRATLDTLVGLLGSVADRTGKHPAAADEPSRSGGVRAAMSHDDDGLPSGFDQVQYAGSSDRPEEQMALGALMALINLSHHNAVVNAALAELQVVGVVMEHLASSQMEIRKAATLFLAGIVAAGSEHARAIADYTHPAGAVDGVELLLCNLSDDDDDDDLSQHSFLVLSNMEATAAERMVASVDRYLNALPSAEPLGSGMGTDAGTEPSDLLVSLGHTEVCTRLDKYFAVLNGLIYSKPVVRKFIAATHGIGWILKLLLRDVGPMPSLVEHACTLLSNLVVVEPKLQERAREQRAFETISRYLQRVDRTAPGANGSAEIDDEGNGEAVTILYTLLQKLAFNHTANIRSAGADVGLLRCLQADCRAESGPQELRDAAAELLLQLSTPTAASASPAGPLVRLVLELQRGAVLATLSSSSSNSAAARLGVSEVVAAKASQWLRDGGHAAE